MDCPIKIPELLDKLQNSQIDLFEFLTAVTEGTNTILSRMNVIKCIKQKCKPGDWHVPGYTEVAVFTREIIPYLEHLENRIIYLENQLNEKQRTSGEL